MLDVLSDPISAWHLSRLRDRDTGPAAFRQHAQVLGTLLAARALADMPQADVEVTTPLTTTTMQLPAGRVVAVPVLRAGLGLLPGVQALVPNVLVGMIGLERDEETLQAREYYRKLPPLEGQVLVLEPMLATGGSAADAAARLRDAGAEHLTVLAVVATQQAVDHITDAVEGTRIVTAALDPELDENGYIVPGLGDFGDRLVGTVE